MGVRQRELVAPFLALKITLVIVGEGTGPVQGEAVGKNRGRPRDAGSPRPRPDQPSMERLKVETPGPASKSSTPHWQGKGWVGTFLPV